MSNMLVIGGTGFAGAFIAAEAAKRNHKVTVLSRSKPQVEVSGVSYELGSALDPILRVKLLENADVVVGAVSPRGDMAGKVAELYEMLAAEAAEYGTRFVIVGGFSSLRASADQPRFFESGDVPAEYLAEAQEIAAVFDNLKANTPDKLNWVFISPAAIFGAYAKVSDYGTVRVGGDVALFDENGESNISGADFAIGVVDEIEADEHHSENISLVH